MLEFRKILIAFLAWQLLISLPLLAAAQINEKRSRRGVKIVKNEAQKRVDVLIDGELFTSYIWAENLKKPILYPIKTANGTFITRKFPLESQTGESVDHPHQIGLWFNYGDVNGVDFWNNSIYRTPPEAAKMGTIVHRRIAGTKNGKTSGELTVEMDWLMPDGNVILREKAKFIFHAEKDLRSIDRITTLSALGEKVVFNDSKEGLFGLRLRRELEQPAKEPIYLTDANGKPSEQKILDNTNVSGEYRSSEGKIGDEVWGTRGKWALLSGTVENEALTIAILDNPKNVGFPTFWMARGYGLFAANPLGQKAYSTEKKELQIKELKFTLEPKQSVKFSYRVLILSQKATPEQIETDYQDFIKQVK
ncbi:MAG: PmoA family protein [Actinomycetota bacterium]